MTMNPLSRTVIIVVNLCICQLVIFRGLREDVKPEPKPDQVKSIMWLGLVASLSLGCSHLCKPNIFSIYLYFSPSGMPYHIRYASLVMNPKLKIAFNIEMRGIFQHTKTTGRPFQSNLRMNTSTRKKTCIWHLQAISLSFFFSFFFKLQIKLIKNGSVKPNARH